jgi:hypothetical protein
VLVGQFLSKVVVYGKCVAVLRRAQGSCVKSVEFSLDMEFSLSLAVSKLLVYMPWAMGGSEDENILSAASFLRRSLAFFCLVGGGLAGAIATVSALGGRQPQARHQP